MKVDTLLTEDVTFRGFSQHHVCEKCFPCNKSPSLSFVTSTQPILFLHDIWLSTIDEQSTLIYYII